MLKKVAKEFNLNFNTRNNFKFLVLTNREIIIRNFLAGAPNLLYIKYGNQEKRRIGINLTNYLQSEEYKRDTHRPHASVISQSNLKLELKLISKIENEKIKKETEILYNKIRKKIGQTKRLTLIWKPKKEEKNKWKEVLLHEFIHELMKENKIRPKSWKWNEGLVTYATHFALNKHKEFEDFPPLGKSKMWNIYAVYAHKWAKLLKNVKNPQERKQMIINKIEEVDKRCKKRT